MNIIMKAFLLSVIAVFFSCRGEKWDDKLTLPKQDYLGNELRIDGYYYNITESNSYSIYFFYKNGTVLYGTTANANNLQSLELSFVNGEFYNTAKGYKSLWGRFVIEENIIKREYWLDNTGPFEVWTHEGEILNDTTYKMTKAYRSCKPKKKKEFEQIYHFKQFSPKPDSTNAYTN